MRRLVWVMVLACPWMVGCAQPYQRITLVDCTLEFQHVRRVGDWDEWLEITACVERVLDQDWQELDMSRLPSEHDQARCEAANREPTYTLLKSETVGAGKIVVRDYQASFMAPFLDTLNKVNGAVLDLKKKPVKYGSIDFRLLERTAMLRYRSNYAVIDIGVTVSGETVPLALVVMFPHDEPRKEFHADGEGRWGFATKIAPDRSWIYGYSIDPISKVHRYFRVNVHTQMEAPILNKEEFERLRKDEP